MMYYSNLHIQFKKGCVLTFILGSLLLAGCASTDVAKSETSATKVVSEQQNPVDPYEHINRKIYGFNNKLDKYVAKPISDAYLWVTPQFVQTGIANFFNNLNDISVVLNNTLQGKFEQGAEDTGRFLLNSTVGLAGIFDVAKEVGLKKHQEDFAQTLAVWGVPDGPYLVLPVLGPATTRGVPGAVMDTATNPVSYVGYPVQLLSMLNSRANAEGSLKFIDEAALDPYVFTREAYLQHRKYLVKDGEIEVNHDVAELEDAFYEDEDESFDAAEKTDKGVADTANSAEQEDLAETGGYTLKLSGEKNSFNQTSESFENALKSFQEASHSYQEASKKLDQIRH